MTAPLGFTSSSPSLNRREGLPAHRITTASKYPMALPSTASARALINLTSDRPNSLSVVARKDAGRRRLSIKVSLRCEFAILSGRPGTPPPVPRSRTFPARSGITWPKSKLSKMTLCRIQQGSEDPINRREYCHFISKSRYLRNRSVCLREIGQPRIFAAPIRRCSSIETPLRVVRPESISIVCLSSVGPLTECRTLRGLRPRVPPASVFSS